MVVILWCIFLSVVVELKEICVSTTRDIDEVGEALNEPEPHLNPRLREANIQPLMALGGPGSSPKHCSRRVNIAYVYRTPHSKGRQVVEDVPGHERPLMALQVRILPGAFIAYGLGAQFLLIGPIHEEGHRQRNQTPLRDGVISKANCKKA